MLERLLTLTIPLSSQRGTSFKDLGADSFDLLQLVTDLEQEFDMTFDAENIDEMLPLVTQ